jgi:hypothetical protein
MLHLHICASYTLPVPKKSQLFPYEYLSIHVKCISKAKNKAIPVTGRGGQQDCETSRIQHCPDNWFTDGGEVVSITRRPRFIPRNILGTHFC